MELLLIKDDLWDLVKQELPAQPEAVWRIKDGKARALIGLSIEDNQLTHLKNQTTAKGYWESLKSYHERSTLSNKVSLLKQLCMLRLDKDEDMERHLARIEELSDKLIALGQEFVNPLIVAITLASLPDSYGTMIMAFETRPARDLTIEYIKEKLLEEYTRRKENHDPDNGRGKALTVKVFARQDGGKKGKQFHDNKRGECFFCKKLGHQKKDCFKYIAWKKNNPNHSAKQVKDNHIGGENDHSCFSICQEKFDGDKWYVDSGATAHMTSNEEFFATLDRSVNQKVTLADGGEITVEGKGDGELQCKMVGDKLRMIIVKDVLYVPALKGNLLSVKKLTNNGMAVTFRDEKCEIQNNGVTLATATLHGQLFVLDTHKPHCASVVSLRHTQNCLHTWHRKLGHRDPKAIQTLFSNHLAEGIQVTDCGIRMKCESCIQGKFARLPFPQSTSQSEAVLDLVHSDLCGPMQTETPGKRKYVLTFIDDYSRYVEVYLLTKKSEVIDRLKDYVQTTKTKFGKTLKVLRTDRGGEYAGEELQRYLFKEGIAHQQTAPYSPQQNGIAERRNRYLMEMSRCMLIDAHLPKRFWGEAVNTAAYLQNRLPTRACATTPYELWEGKKPDLTEIRIFGSKVYMKIPDEHRKKLDAKATPRLFVGYERGSKAYRLLDVATNRVQISRDVQFMENSPDDETSIKPDRFERAVNETNTTFFEQVELNGPLDTVDEPKEEQSIDKVVQRQSQRITKGRKPQRLIEQANVSLEPPIVEPTTRRAALSGPHATQWSNAMDEEMNSLQNSGTWVVQSLPPGKQAIGSKWVFKVKYDEKGNVNRFKARLVAKGFAQKYGRDFDEVFAPVVTSTALRTLLAIAGRRKLLVHHYDIETAFLNGDLQHDVYIKQPEGYSLGNETDVCKLSKNIYGLKQGAQEWHKKLHDVFMKNGFKRSDADPCIYSKSIDTDYLYVLTYVDDFIAAVNEATSLNYFSATFSKEFKVNDLGDLKHFLGIKFSRNKDGVFRMNQKLYIERKLKEFNLIDSRGSRIPIDPGYQKSGKINDLQHDNNECYRAAIGSLLYIATHTRPDIAAAVSILARKVETPTQQDWIEVKRTLAYLKKSINLSLELGAVNESEQLVGYADADWGGDPNDRKSNTGYVFSICGATISWSCKKQKMVTLSSTEAEFIALAEASREAIWLMELLKTFHMEFSKPVLIHEDNQSSIHLLENAKICQRSKHIDVKYHFVCDLKRHGIIEVKYCPTEHMIADLLTKPLNALALERQVNAIGLKD